MYKEKAIKATNQGAVVACISGCITLLIAMVSITVDNTTGPLIMFNDPWMLFDVIFIFGCAYGIYKKSRFVAILLFCYYIFSRIYLSIEMGKPTGVVFAIVVLIFYGRAIQGAFLYHKIVKLDNPYY